MCKGSDVLKVAAVAAAVYTGGTSLGLFGAAEGAGAAAGAGGFDALTAADAAAGSAGTSLAAGATGAETISAMGAAETAAGATGAAVAAGGTYAPVEDASSSLNTTGGTTAASSGAATGAKTWLQTAKSVAPFVSAAGSALTGIAALSAPRPGMPSGPDVPLLGAQPGVSPDLYATLKKKNALLFGGSGAESTDLGGGTAGAPTLGKNTLLGS